MTRIGTRVAKDEKFACAKSACSTRFYNVTDRSDQLALLREQKPINKENRWNVRRFGKAYVHSESHGAWKCSNFSVSFK